MFWCLFSWCLPSGWNSFISPFCPEDPVFGPRDMGKGVEWGAFQPQQRCASSAQSEALPGESCWFPLPSQTPGQLPCSMWSHHRI